MNRVLLAAIDAQCRLFLVHTDLRDKQTDIAALNKLTREYIDQEMNPPALVGVKLAGVATPQDIRG
jgi:hypothetical protein